MGLQHLAAKGGQSTYDAVRAALLASGKRRAPSSRTALWTVARDILAEMARLKLATVGALPRKLSDFERLRETPCELTAEGQRLAALFTEKAGQAYDTLLLRWLAEHPYFRLVALRLDRGPLYVPDLTNLGQLGLDGNKPRSVASMTTDLISNCSARLEAVEWPAPKLAQFTQSMERRFSEQANTLAAPGTDAKRLIDLVQDTIVIPSLLEAESLPFDAVTFSQILKCAQEFLCAAWTASHPQFAGRILFPTCEFNPPLDHDRPPTQVIHHGVTYAGPRFEEALRRAYSQTVGSNASYASAYAMRAVVCVELRMPLAVFSRCLEALIGAGTNSGMTVYTELPFEPPPQGEGYIEVSKRRVGRLKIV